MTSKELRDNFLKFFEKNGHAIVPSSSLLPADPSVLFTTAGMQQFKQYFLGEKSPYGDKVASCQKCFRTSDIEEVGDERHLTFFEMLGNFSFGGYGKEKAIKLAKDFLDSINIKINYVTVFGGDRDIPKDEESAKIWGKLGFSEANGNLRFEGRKDNFWGPTGEEGPCGPTTEIYVHGIEIWNLVFNEYYQDKDKKFTPLKQKGVDTGMGLERLAMVSGGKANIFETDLFSPIISELRSLASKLEAKLLSSDEKAERIIADHIKGAVFLISEGIAPSNVERGYILRRILRRAIRYGNVLGLAEHNLIALAKKVLEIYKDVYPEIAAREADILTAIQNEEEKFKKTLNEGLRQFEKGLDAFELYTTYGFPIELTLELAKEKGIQINIEEFNKKFKEHQEISRAGAEKKFKGGLADHSEKTTKYHTATHLLLAAMREILGPEIYQKGSNITAERLRFDFNYPQRLSEGQVEKIGNLVNRKIKEDIAVEMIEIPKSEALKIAKISFDPAKYGEIVKVYKINDFSIELCGGPHVKRTGELGHFKIIKEESSGAGIRRIRAILE
ncbi:MAG: alanine--tRNA ligase [Candidatus Nealsonbacteria bacterium]|nr:alanine--tRNA ligase [Candidatus Nealsonbacteria bacterium]